MTKGKNNNKSIKIRLNVHAELIIGNKQAGSVVPINDFITESITLPIENYDDLKKQIFNKISKRAKNRIRDNIENHIADIVKKSGSPNIYLILSKFTPLSVFRIKVENDNQQNNRTIFNFNDTFYMAENFKGDFLKAMLDNYSLSEDLRGIISNIKNATQHIQNILSTQYKFKILLDKTFTTTSRLVVGLGTAHVLETSLTLHHTYGIPYIPGSAFKGVVRAVAFWKIVEEWQDNAQEQDFTRYITGKREDSKEIRLQELQKAFNGQPIWESERSPILRELPDNVKRTFGCYQLLFGAAGFKGLLTFLDLYPEIPKGGNFFELDVMTPHYAPYYQDPEKNHPGDWYNPKPIPFLTVKPGVRFRSVILFDEWRYERLDEKYRRYLPDKKYILPDEDMNNGNILEGLVKEALENFGVGAKTRLGYGRFRNEDTA